MPANYLYFSEFVENLAYDVSEQFGDKFKTWLCEDKNRNTGTEAKVGDDIQSINWSQNLQSIIYHCLNISLMTKKCSPMSRKKIHITVFLLLFAVWKRNWRIKSHFLPGTRVVQDVEGLCWRGCHHRQLRRADEGSGQGLCFAIKKIF